MPRAPTGRLPPAGRPANDLAGVGVRPRPLRAGGPRSRTVRIVSLASSSRSLVCRGYASRPGASDLRGQRPGAPRADLQRRAGLSKRKHTTGPAGLATRAPWGATRAEWPARRPAGRVLPAGRAARPLLGQGALGQDALAASHGRAQTAVYATPYMRERQAHYARQYTQIGMGRSSRWCACQALTVHDTFLARALSRRVATTLELPCTPIRSEVI